MKTFKYLRGLVFVLMIIVATIGCDILKESGNPTEPEMPSEEVMPFNGEPDETVVEELQVTAPMLKTATGFYYPAERSDTGGLIGWMGFHSVYKKYHLGVDFRKNQGETVRAISDGTVVYSSMNAGGYGCSGTPGGAMVVQHKTSDGTVFTAIYGHIQNILPVNSKVAAGAKIAEIGACYNNIQHLHFGIHLGTSVTLQGYTTSSSEQDANKAGWYNSLKFIETNRPMNAGGSSCPDCDKYDNKDPIAMGCASDAITVASTNIYSSGVRIAFLEQRWSNRCGTNWGKVTRYDGRTGETMTLKEERSNPSKIVTTSLSGYSQIYSNMVYARGIPARACATVQGITACTAWK